MSFDFQDDVIDLTDSLITDSLTLVDHCAMSNLIIDLDTDESFYESGEIDGSKTLERLSTKSINTSQCQNKESKISKNSKRNSKSFGDCPICMDELGRRPLASTKCGHVYCLKCLETSLRVEKKCPTCRSSLKGKAAYHPLYLFKN